MFGQHKWTISIATSISVLGLTIASGLLMLAHRFVEELSRPHNLSGEKQFSWGLPPDVPEPLSSCKRSLLFKANDGTLLRGEFWAQPHPAPTVVVCHGYHVSRAHLRPAAALEYKYGYNVLLFDFRGHGESESVATSGGNAEVRDLEAALAVASRQPETLPGKIIIHGFSMGASIALLTLPHPDVVAIIADSPYARLDDILRRLVHSRLMQGTASWNPSFRLFRSTFPAVAWATVLAATVVFRLRFGHALIARPDTIFKRWRKLSKAILHTPILLIHGSGDSLIPIAHARQLVAKARAHNIQLQTYFVDHARHCGAYGSDPQQYITVLQKFLSPHLGEAFPDNQ